MEPRVQYAKTADGVSIAYCRDGQGTPFVHLSPTFPFTHLQLESTVPGWEKWCGILAQISMLVRLDHRGCGLSARVPGGLSIDEMVQDIEAVADRLSLDNFILAGVFHTGPAAIAYAARNPDRVSRLLLWCTYSRGSQVDSAEAQAVMGLLDKNWMVFTQTYAHLLFGWPQALSRQTGSFAREVISQEDARAAFQALAGFDVTPLLPQVTSPTLVVQKREFPFLDTGVGKELASAIPDSRLVDLQGNSLAPWIGDAELARRSVLEFLVEQSARALDTAPGQASLFRTMLFTDVVGHTEMMLRLGDERGREVLREHERITREVLKAHGGAEVKTMGDGFMASFASVTKAVECAVALQREIGNRQAEIGEPIEVRCGLNAGEPIEEEGDLFGATVILAARIAAKAEGGEILCSDVVRGLSSGKGFLFADRGEFVAKGFEEPVRVYEVRWRDE